MIARDLQPLLLKDLEEHDKMLFVSGARQCGKTTLARSLLDQVRIGRYWNFDIPEDRVLIVKNPAFYEAIDRGKGVMPLVVLDEIHKQPNWKNYLKGAFDRSHIDYRFLITGSGRLDLYRKGGDSLAGRYFLYHLFPLTVNEMVSKRLPAEEFFRAPDELPEAKEDTWTAWRSLEALSGFPEPFVQGTETFYRKWAMPYIKQIIREDIRDMTQIKQISQMEILAALLPERVGSLLSINSLREDIRVAFETLRNWISVFENFFYVFLVLPWSKNLSRAIQKEPKLYLYNWASVSDASARFENMVALHLLKAVTHWTEQGLGDFRLHFVRDRQKNEVDFLLTKDKKPLLLVESKQSETDPAPALVKMKKNFGVPAVQLVNEPGVSRKISRKEENLLVVSADRWLSSLP